MKINFATVGTSWICEEFIDTAKSFDEFNLKAVYSRDEKKALEYAKKHGAEKAYSNLEEMAADKEIDAVYISSPNSLHMPQSVLFLNNAKHVLCEKPIASNLRETKIMIEAAQKNKMFLMEAYKSMLMPGLVEIKKNIHKLGKIRNVYANFSKYSSRYDAHKEGKPVNTFKAEFANGALMDLGVYCLYPVLCIFGEPQEIKAFSNVVPGGVDGAGCMIMKYDSFTATLNYSKVSTSYLPCEIQGEDATMLIDKFNIPEKYEIIYRDKSKPTEKAEISQKSESMYYEIAEFFDCIKNGKLQSDINSHSLSLSAMKIIDEARKQSGVVYPADLL